MDDTQEKATINYELLVEDALRTVVRGSLALVEHEGLPGDSHFYITFKTTADGVQMSETLRNANPQEMTIVLQHQFWDLHVSETHFSVTLSFSGVQHNLNVPFSAVTHFTDPSVGFGLQFSVAEDTDQDNDGSSLSLAEIADMPQLKNTESDDEETAKPAAKSTGNQADDTASSGNMEDAQPGDSAEIVSLDRFRKDPPK